MIHITLFELNWACRYFGILMIGGTQSRSLFYIELNENNKLQWLEIFFIRIKTITWN